MNKIVSTEPLKVSAPWKCNNCGHEILAKQIAWGNLSLQREIEILDKKSPEAFEEFLLKYKETLHDQNTHVLQIKYALTQLYGNVPGFMMHGNHFIVYQFVIITDAHLFMGKY